MCKLQLLYRIYVRGDSDVNWGYQMLKNNRGEAW